MNLGLDRLARDISFRIEDELQRSGIFYRIFARAKSVESIEKKLVDKDYENSSENKKMQDLIGIRITLYFDDDLPIVYQAIKKRFNFIDETVDELCVNKFEPERVNLVLKMTKEDAKEATDLAISKYKYIDTTYEVQLRTVLSEGWHEVEHDFRYKCQKDWEDYSDISHIFNGVYASLVTSDWTIMAIFEKLAYSHFKKNNWNAMLRNKFRLRFKDTELDSRIIEILDMDKELSKELFKTDRSLILDKIFNDGIRIPLTLSNLIYIVNAYCLEDSRISSMAPDYIKNNKKLFKK
jgi:ppGpp synthetase/RelA/SpoT-type nucleotidyltranferase